MEKPTRGPARGATVALVLLTAMNVVNYLDRYILTAVQEQIKGEFRVTDDQIGTLTFWFMMAYMCASPVTGWLGDRFSRKPMIVVAALLMSVMNFFTSSVHGYDSLNVRHAFLGIGEASFGIFAPALLADFYPENARNRVMTIFNVAIPVGAALGVKAGAWVGSHYGWRKSFEVSAYPGALIALLILLLMREPERTGSVEEQAQKPHAEGFFPNLLAEGRAILTLFRNKAYLGAIFGYAAVTFALGGISWWMPSFLQRVGGYTQDQAGNIMGPVIVVAGLGGTALGGVIASWWSRRTSKALYYVPAISSVLTVPPAMICFFGPKNLMVPSLFVAVFLIFIGTGPTNAATLNAVSANMRATAMAGQLLVIHLLGDSTSPKIIGLVSDHANLRLGLGCTLITLVLAGIIFFLGARWAPALDDSNPSVDSGSPSHA